VPNRRQPSQERGKLNYDRIIDAAKSLIGQRGADDVSIRDIAKLAEVAPSTIYQYFEDKNAIIIAVMELFFDQTYERLLKNTQSITSLPEWVRALESSMDFFIDQLRKDPDWMMIWNSVQASPTLREYDNKDALRTIELIQQQLMQFSLNISKEKAFYASTLMVHLLSTTARMCLMSEQSVSDKLMDEYKHLIRLRIREIAI